MKKNKLLKTLAAISLSAVAAAGCISLAACGHTHSTTEGWKSDADKHWHVCDEDGEKFDEAAHTYVDGKCSVCDKAEPAGGGNEGGGSGSEVTAHTSTYSYAAITGMTADKQTLTQADFTGANAFLTIGEGVTYRNKALDPKGTAPDAIELKNDGISVTFQGTGTITIGFASTGGSNTSGFALIDASGAYLEGTTTATKLAADETIAEGYVNKAGLYTVTGTTAVTVTYTISTAGTYKLYSLYCYLKDSAGTSRGGRITSITMTDNY